MSDAVAGFLFLILKLLIFLILEWLIFLWLGFVLRETNGGNEDGREADSKTFHKKNRAGRCSNF